MRLGLSRGVHATALFSGVSLIILCAFASAQRPGGFSVVGPGGGGAMFHPTISPHDPNTVLVACDMTGSYITHDGGRSWRMFNLRGVTKFFVFDPSDAKTMYVQADGLWRSTDGGENWNLVYPKPSSIKGVDMSSDHADEKIVATPDPVGAIQAMAVDPKDSHTLYAAGGGKSPTLFISHDYGDSWQASEQLPEAPLRLWVFPKSSASERMILIAGSHFVVVKSGGMVHKSPVPESVAFEDVSAGFADGKPVIYAVSASGIFVSADSGTSWQKAALPGSGAEVRAIATSLHHPATAYVSYSKLLLDGHTWDGVAKTTDAGKTWQFVWKEDASAAKNVHDAWITARFGTGWGENPLTLGVAEENPNICYATDLGRTLITTDGGASWTAAYSKRVDGADWTSTGLDVTNAYGIHFDPFDKNREFITYTDIGLFRSEDRGKSWVSSTTGVPEKWLNTTYWMVFDPKVPGRAWSVNSGTHDLPRPKMWRHTPSDRFKGGVTRSSDGGRTWVKSNKGMAETAATHILLDPSSPVDARVLYVAGFGRGVYKSTDGGSSWSLKNNGITQQDPFAWRLARASDGTLYVLIARRSEDGSIGNAGDGAIYVSKDGAETWKPVALPSGANAPNGLAVDPRNPQRLYLAAWARATGGHGTGGGIFVSEDGGQHWTQSLDRDQHVYDVVIDPRNSDKLYAAGFESSAWRSVDQGKHWTRIPGFNFKWGQRVVPDPADENSVYITTFGGGVWHGSVNGKPEPVDIATPAMEPRP